MKKHERKKQKINEKGITLIALVITIIVLLILAGVSIATLTGENGILTQANKAKTETEKAAIEEQRLLAQVEANMHLENYPYTDSNGDTAIVPAGFAVSYVEEERNIDTGLVIIDTEGNEFVWIPVADKTSYTKKLGKNNSWLLPGDTSAVGTLEESITGDDLGMPADKNLETTFGAGKTEADVVSEAKGFWVGRYEAGIESTDVANTIDWKTAKVVSKQGVQPARNITQTDSVNLANNWLNGTNVKSGLITGTQWDMMCKFIGGTTDGNYGICDQDCSTWGNYGNVVSAPYTGYCSPDGSSAWIMVENKVKSGDFKERFIFPTGRFVTDKNGTTNKKNIYDVAGNVWEWTTEIPARSEGNRVIRGGSNR